MSLSDEKCIKRVLKADGDPPCKILVGDCREIMPFVSPESVDLIFADPPFNIGEPYSEWKDTLPGKEYRKFTEEWLDGCVRLLKPSGSLWVNCPNEIAARVVVHLEDNHGLVQADWCCWHYRFGQWTDRGFIKSKSHALHYVRDKSLAVWNPDEILVSSDRKSKYKDSRTENTKNPGKRVPLDVWGVTDAFDPDYPGDGPNWGRIQGQNAERRPQHSNQLPERYLERVIRSTSNPGDFVLTPFAGSGTELVVARALGRVGMGIEIGVKEAHSAFERVKNGAVRIK